jgi:hypothetical protein
MNQDRLYDFDGVIASVYAQQFDLPRQSMEIN